MKHCKGIACEAIYPSEDPHDFCEKCRARAKADLYTVPGYAVNSLSNALSLDSTLPPPEAADILRATLKHLDQRALTHDAPEGERSIPKVVELFNCLTGHKLTATEGWKFMILLKLVRSCQGAHKDDDYEDMAGYSALAGEEAARCAHHGDCAC